MSTSSSSAPAATASSVAHARPADRPGRITGSSPATVRRARPSATLMLLAGTGLALAALVTRDTSGEVGLAPMLGWIGMLPSLAGLAAVWMLWATPATRRLPKAGS